MTASEWIESVSKSANVSLREMAKRLHLGPQRFWDKLYQGQLTAREFVDILYSSHVDVTYTCTDDNVQIKDVSQMVETLCDIKMRADDMLTLLNALGIQISMKRDAGLPIGMTFRGYGPRVRRAHNGIYYDTEASDLVASTFFLDKVHEFEGDGTAREIYVNRRHQYFMITYYERGMDTGAVKPRFTLLTQEDVDNAKETFNDPMFIQEKIQERDESGVVDVGESRTGDPDDLIGFGKEYDPDFKRWWKKYPVKRNKAKGYRRYLIQLNAGYTKEELDEALDNYLRECKEMNVPKSERMYAQTFLNADGVFLQYLPKKDQ